MSQTPENREELAEKASAFEARIRALTQEFSRQVAEEGQKIGLEVVAEVSIKIHSHDD